MTIEAELGHRCRDDGAVLLTLDISGACGRFEFNAPVYIERVTLGGDDGLRGKGTLRFVDALHIASAFRGAEKAIEAAAGMMLEDVADVAEEQLLEKLNLPNDDD